MPIESKTGATIGELRRDAEDVVKTDCGDKGNVSPKSESEAKDEFIARIEHQKEINELIELCFKHKFTLNCDDFGHIIDHVDSAMFLCMLSLLRTRLPSLDEFKRYESALKRPKGGDKVLSPRSGRKMATSKVLSKFANACGDSSPSGSGHSAKPPLVRSSSQAILATSKSSATNLSPTAKASESTKPKSKFAGEKNPLVYASVDSPIMPAVRLANAKEGLVDVTRSPTATLAPEQSWDDQQLLFCQCGKQIRDFDRLQCDSCISKQVAPTCEGCLRSRSKPTGKLKQMWYVIQKREMYCM